MESSGNVRVEYLAQWKDGSPDTWEEGINLSEDLIREYEERWWGASRKGDFKTLAKMLEGGRQVRGCERKCRCERGCVWDGSGICRFLRLQFFLAFGVGFFEAVDLCRVRCVM